MILLNYFALYMLVANFKLLVKIQNWTTLLDYLEPVNRQYFYTVSAVSVQYSAPQDGYPSKANEDGTRRCLSAKSLLGLPCELQVLHNNL